MFNIRPDFGFNIPPDAKTSGFRVGALQDVPGFRVRPFREVPGFHAGADGDALANVLRALQPSSSVQAFEYDPYGNARQATSLLTDFGYPSSVGSGQRDAVGSTTSDLRITFPGTGTIVGASGPGQSQYQRCLDRCYPLLERRQLPGSDRNTWDFHKCMRKCMGE